MLIVLPVKGKDVERLFNVPPELWKLLGMELGINMETLDAIEKEYVGDRDRLHALFDNIKPPITRGVVKRVLRSQTILKNAVSGTNIAPFTLQHLERAPGLAYK